MFSPTQWAEAYIDVCKTDVFESEGGISDSGLEVLKSAEYCLSKIKGGISGIAAAAQFNGFLQKALEKSGYEQKDLSIESERAVLFLLIKKGHSTHLGLLISTIEKLIQKDKKILTINIDCVEAPPPPFIESLKKLYIEKTGAKEVIVLINIKPELLGGYRINISGERLDFSIKRRLEQLESRLSK
jgi:F0F1-type ATP synthase delta subunit